ncbi:hypothetical protein MLPF_2805 [Mycobacterium lepromatosis]|nr:hypothetical protein MLPF_0063 [Mycobacterium lepromatosis]UKN42894.1 hypothetical protein MLPF_2805 [Mycobacterium lepromatosis]
MDSTVTFSMPASMSCWANSTMADYGPGACGHVSHTAEPSPRFGRSLFVFGFRNLSPPDPTLPQASGLFLRCAATWLAFQLNPSHYIVDRSSKVLIQEKQNSDRHARSSSTWPFHRSDPDVKLGYRLTSP